MVHPDRALVEVSEVASDTTADIQGSTEMASAKVPPVRSLNVEQSLPPHRTALLKPSRVGLGCRVFVDVVIQHWKLRYFRRSLLDHGIEETMSSRARVKKPLAYVASGKLSEVIDPRRLRELASGSRSSRSSSIDVRLDRSSRST